MEEQPARKMVFTLDEKGKRGASMELEMYERLRAFILQTLESAGDTTFSDLLARAEKEFYPKTEIGWHLLKVKTDLEARGLVEKEWRPGLERTQVLRFKKQKRKG